MGVTKHHNFAGLHRRACPARVNAGLMRSAKSVSKTAILGRTPTGDPVQRGVDLVIRASSAKMARLYALKESPSP